MTSWVLNGPFAPKKEFFSEKPLLWLLCTISPNHCAKLKKKLLEPIHSHEDRLFLGPKWSICPKQTFFGEKSLILFSSTYWSISLCQILKIFYKRPRVMRMRRFWTQNGTIFLNKNFSEKLLINLQSVS